MIAEFSHIDSATRVSICPYTCLHYKKAFRRWLLHRSWLAICWQWSSLSLLCLLYTFT